MPRKKVGETSSYGNHTARRTARSLEIVKRESLLSAFNGNTIIVPNLPQKPEVSPATFFEVGSSIVEWSFASIKFSPSIHLQAYAGAETKTV